MYGGSLIGLSVFAYFMLVGFTRDQIRTPRFIVHGNILTEQADCFPTHQWFAADQVGLAYPRFGFLPQHARGIVFVGADAV
jgi:hypothetical protein